MKIYLDLVFLLNFGFDFMLLLSVSILLKRRASIKRLLLGSFIGASTIFCLFIKINSLELFLIKFIVSVIMVLISFSYKNVNYTFKNILYLYITSIVLGGFLYYLNIEFSYKHDGLIFYHDGLSINFVILVLSSPIILYNYVKQEKEKHEKLEYYYKVNITLNNKQYRLTGYLDTGNILEDPYFHKPIIVINPNIIKDNAITKNIYVPISTASSNSLMKCFYVDKIEIEGFKTKKHVLVGISPEKIKFDGIDVLLNIKLMEG